MAAPKPNQRVNWKCRHCGTGKSALASSGRPLPGQCPKNKNSSGKMGPHSWEKIG